MINIIKNNTNQGGKYGISITTKLCGDRTRRDDVFGWRWLEKHWWNKTSNVGIAIDAISYLVPILSAYHGLRKVGKLASKGRSYIRTNIDKALREARISLGIAAVSGVVDMLFLVVGGSPGSWIATAADYADKWFGSYGRDGYING